MRPLILLTGLVALASGSGYAQADLIVHNAIIYTADGARPRVEAFAVKDGRIVFVGSTREAKALRGERTEVLDLAGATVIPGMVDAHAHLLGLGAFLQIVDLKDAKSYDELIARVRDAARTAPPGSWIRGRGWDQNRWADTRFPTHESLSAAVPDHPVYLTRVDGHAALVNARALALAGITAKTPDPDGGKIMRGARGDATGVLIDRAMALVTRKLPPSTRQELKQQAQLAIAEANRWGLTGVHDAGVRLADLAAFEELAREGNYHLRHYVMLRALSDTDAILDTAFATGPRNALYNGRLWVRAIKITVDGAMGSRGAALLEPYADDPGNTGIIQIPAEQVQRVAARALAAGFQVNAHAIGDRANRETLNAFEAAFTGHPIADHRFRIEHAQILSPSDIGRFAPLGVIPSMQGSHQTSDMYWVGSRLGYGRLLGAYAWRSLLATGVIIPNGSDFPVEAVNPLISFHSFVARQDEAGWPAGGWFPGQRTTREEALLSVTLWPAYASFMEKESGSLTPGKYADFVVLDRDIMTVPAEQILETKVLRTVLDGRTVYESVSGKR